MSTCANEAGASTLFGSPKVYAGSDSYGQLTGGLRAKPNAIVLLDETKKASPDVLTRFLTAWNDGFVTEASTGEKIATNRAIFIATTNAASKEISDLSKTITDRDQRLKAVNDALREARFKPEVLSRVDKVFAFDPITGLDQARLAIVQVRAIARGFGLEITEEGDGIDAAVLYDMMDRAGLLQDAGGVRAVVRALEESLADGFISVKKAGHDRCRVVLDHDTGFKVEAA
jgi:ATP-dependent Clp protease ATP-binding subunit ClpA